MTFLNKTRTDLYTVTGEYSMNGRIKACIVGQECPAMLLDVVRRNDSGTDWKEKKILQKKHNFVVFIGFQSINSPELPSM